MREITIHQAMNQALAEEMRRDASVFVQGLCIDPSPPGSVTAGLREEFGPTRVRSTPMSETAIAGSCVGAALAGLRPVAQLHLADFAFCALDEILSKAGKWRYMHGANGDMKLPIVFLEMIGGYVNAAAEHSQSPLALYWHAPGLKIAVPTTPRDAKGLLTTALRDDNPVVFFVHKLLGEATGPVPEGECSVPFGSAAIRRAGEDITIVATSYMVTLTLEAAAILERDGVTAEVIDPRTLEPLDIDTIVASVQKTGHLVVVDEDTERCGVGAEIGAQVIERAFDALRAPIRRIANPNLPVPYSTPLEQAVLPSAAKIVGAVRGRLPRS